MRWYPEFCLSCITAGNEEQSRRNCITVCVDLLLRAHEIMSLRILFSDATDWHKSSILFLSSLNAGQKSKRCSKEPKSFPVHEGIVHVPDLFCVQCLESWSVTPARQHFCLYYSLVYLIGI